MFERFRAMACAAALSVAGPAIASDVSIDQVGPVGAGPRLAQAADEAGGTSLILQDGGLAAPSLYAMVFQTAPESQSLILQSGSANTALVFQTVNPGSVSSIVQSGTGNFAIVRQ